MKAWFFVIVGLSILIPCQAQIIYVDENASGTNNGSSWANAYNHLQNALSVASSVDEIRMAGGIYRGGFQLINGITIKGGYAGSDQPEPNERDVDEYLTVLSGDIDGNDGPNFVNYEDNSLHVVSCAIAGDSILLDGLTITAGNCNGSGPHDGGAAVYNNQGTLEFVDCTISYNLVQGNSPGSNAIGSGLYNNEGTVSFTGCSISNNKSIGGDGGGFGGPVLYNRNGNLSLDGCTFTDNIAIGGDGGGRAICCIHNNTPNSTGNSYLTLSNCIFSGNQTIGGDGGGEAIGCIYNEAVRDSDAHATLTDCTFTDNLSIAGTFGGSAVGCIINKAIFESAYAKMAMTNCTFYDNRVEADGDAFVTGCVLNKALYDNTRAEMTIIGSQVTDNNIVIGESINKIGFISNNALFGNSQANVTTTNCTIANNTATIGTGFFSICGLLNDEGWSGGQTFFKVENTIVAGHSDTITWMKYDAYGGFDSDSSYNFIAAADGSNLGMGIGTLHGDMDSPLDPCFVDPFSGDYHLKSDSLCIDAGDDSVVTVATDLDGNPRVSGAAVDMGAYERFEANTAPVGDAGDDATVVDLDDNGSEEVTLDGSGSADSDGDIVSWVWTDDLGDTIPDGEIVTADLSVGVHTITLTVTDDGGLTDSDTVIITVVKPILPEIISINPDNAQQGDILSVDITGVNTHFTQGSETICVSIYRVTESGMIVHLEALSCSVINDTLLSALFDFNFDGGYVLGLGEIYDVIVDTPVDGTLILEDGFTLNDPTFLFPPTPDAANQGDSLTITITGWNTNFTQGSTTVWFTQGNSTVINASSYSVSSATSLTAVFNIPADTTTGRWDVKVETSVDGELTLIDGFTVVGPIVYYVDDSAVGVDDGSSWADAFNDLQFALDMAIAGDQIWVAAGTYKPTSDYGLGIGERGKHFRMKNGVAIYGGFNGNETALDQRDMQNNETILSGDLLGNDDPNTPVKDLLDDHSRADNCYHVFYHPEGMTLNASAVLDGFTITAGNANESNGHRGGGIYNHYYCSPTVRNCIFIYNSAKNDGGGMYNRAGNLIVSNCTFSGNLAGRGGGVANEYNSSTFTNCKFYFNSSSSGGGMSNKGIFTASSKPRVIGCIFSGNTAGDGGGMSNIGYYNNPVIRNCTFSGNYAWDDGGGMYNRNGNPSVTNCTFTGNWANDDGGGICNFSDRWTLKNCIVWGNISVSEGNEIYNFDTKKRPTISYSNIGGCFSDDIWNPSIGINNGGNIDDDPEFIDANGADGIIGTEDDNLRLGAGSACIDAGKNSAITAVTDLDGNPRIVNDIVDMGAYEFFNTAPVADAGADQVVYAGVDGTATVKLNGSDSFDADDDTLEYFWFNDANELIAEGVDPNVVFAAGVHVIELIVDDGELSSEPNSVVVTVIEAVEAVAYVFPRVLNVRSRGRYVIARMQLPDGVSKDDVAEDSLVLIIGDVIIETIRQRGISSRGQDYVFGFFDRGAVIAQAEPESEPEAKGKGNGNGNGNGNGKSELDIIIAGELVTGQCVYGEDSIKIVKSQASQKKTLRRMPARNSRGGRGSRGRKW